MATRHGLMPHRCFVCSGPALFAAVCMAPADDGLIELRAVPFCGSHELEAYEFAVDLAEGLPVDAPMKVSAEDLEAALEIAAEYMGVPTYVLQTAG